VIGIKDREMREGDRSESGSGISGMSLISGIRDMSEGE
jgi:hypothetical protein